MNAKCSGMKMQVCYICSISSMVALLYRKDTNTGTKIIMYKIL